MSLDETYERFRADYCDKCPNHKPRPQDWQYTHEWQLAENQANAEFMSGPRSATYDHKPVGPAPLIPMPGNACASCGLDFAEQPAWWCGDLVLPAAGVHEDAFRASSSFLKAPYGPGRR